MELFKGEQDCSAIYKSGLKKGQSCVNGGYYLQDGKVLCGVHSDKAKRTELRVNPNKGKIKDAENTTREAGVVAACTANMKAKRSGEVMSSKLGMRKEVPHFDGFQSVFPNRKHGNRSDGIGYPSLSPMSLGPIEHGQPELPPALNLENLFQSNKCFMSELGADGKPSKVFYDTRLAMYLDPEPHRHKVMPDGKPNQVAFSVWIDKDGSEIHLTYVQSRQVYCHFYEVYALKCPDFTQLKTGVDRGLNVNIIGYDGYDFRQAKGDTLQAKFESCYLDPSRPFGHELVLCALLVLKPSEYPWRKHQTLQF